MKSTLAIPLLLLAMPANATTLKRASLDVLARSNSTIVLGEVIDAQSHWNADRTLIVTDVRIAATEVLKGDASKRELTVTLLGGSVEGLTTIIVGGAELIPGRSYLMFLDEDDLPGTWRALTVRDHCQGVFDLVTDKKGVRAVSQASRHPLVADASGKLDPAGGREGLPLTDLMQAIITEVQR